MPLHRHSLPLQRAFGAWGFEVTTSQAGVRRTVGPVAGRNYEFWLAGKDSSQLVVIEEAVLPGLEGDGGAASGDAAGRKRRMQLLHVGADCSGGGWGAELPVRLLELHSHWLDRWGMPCQCIASWNIECARHPAWCA